jgi:hypothetical protein
MRACFVAASVIACAGSVEAQPTSSALHAPPGRAVAGDGCAIYDNSYTGVSGFGNAAQLFEPTFAGYDIWLGDDFTTDSEFTNIAISSVGFNQDNAGNLGDPFQVKYLDARIYDALPNDPGANLIAESDKALHFDGVDTWTAEFGAQSLPPGDYFFVFAARNDFLTNFQTFFFQEPMAEDNNGFQWNPNGAFGFPDDLMFITDEFGFASSPNACIDGDPVAGDPCDAADCNGDGNINGLDVVCTVMAIKQGDVGADCNEDGVLNVMDLICFIQTFKTCVN